MSRNEQVAVVEAFFAAIVSKDLSRLPVDPDLTAESPLTPKLRGRAALEYLRNVAANVEADKDGPPKGTMLKGPWGELDPRWQNAWLYGHDVEAEFERG